MALSIHPTTLPKPHPPEASLVFGRTFTDHMLNWEWTSSTPTVKGQTTGTWHPPTIRAYAPLQIDPASSALHYAVQCFEGMKAYKDNNGNVRLFRPTMNTKRFQKSAQRIMLPAFDEEKLLDYIKELVNLDEAWIPTQRGYSLYLRPTMIGTGAALGVAPPVAATIFVIACPVGPYWKEGFHAISLLATYKITRAWPGGVGDCKVGGNYAPAIRPQYEASLEGHAQNLWLTHDGHYLTEVGTMNLFVFLLNEAGEKELVTAPLDGVILPGVTRDSILHLTRSWNEFKVSERPMRMEEVTRAVNEGRMLEVFGAGTACVVTPVRNIRYDEVDYAIPLDPNDATSQAGPLTRRLDATIQGIQYGSVEYEDWSVVIN